MGNSAEAHQQVGGWPALEENCEQTPSESVGRGHPGATEFIYKGVEQLLARNTPESDPLCLLQLDFSNAFNRLNRFEMRREVRRMAPKISPWVEYTYSVSAQLIVDHNNNVLSKEGVQQGDPLAPLLFSIGAALWLSSCLPYPVSYVAMVS